MTYKDIPGYCDFHDFYKWAFDQLPEKGTFVEVGVFMGHSVAYMATLAEKARKKINVVAVDTFEGSHEHRLKGITGFYDQFMSNILACKFNYIDLIAVTPNEAAAIDGPVDFVYIDAAHDYESVKADIAAWWPKVKPGGILAGHDYCEAWPGVKKAVDEAFPNRQLTSKSVWFTIKHGQTS